MKSLSSIIFIEQAYTYEKGGVTLTKIAWVTDSTAFLDQELKDNPNVFQIPLTVILDGEEYIDGVDLTADELFERLKSLKTPPTTSQPSVGAFQQLYEKLENDYDVIVSILLSAKLSGTVNSSEQAAKLISKPVYTIDSKILSYPLTALLKSGIHLAEKGLSVEEIIDQLSMVIESNETYVLVGSLEQLHRSGRMSGLQFFLGSMLNIKPLISIENGSLNAKEKVRSEVKAKDRIFDYLRKANEKQPIKEVYLLYGLHERVALEWKEELREEFTNIECITSPLGATIGVHAGENTIGISWFNHRV